MGIYGDLWGFMGTNNILSLAINPHSDLWVIINPHKSPFPINPTSPDVYIEAKDHYKSYKPVSSEMFTSVFADIYVELLRK